MLTILNKNKQTLVIESLTFNDTCLDRDQDQKLNVSGSVQCHKKYYSLDLKKVRVDCTVSYVGIFDNQDIAFTLNASVKVIFNVKNGVTEAELNAVINDGSDKNLNCFNELVTPIVQQEMIQFLSKTDYTIADSKAN